MSTTILTILIVPLVSMFVVTLVPIRFRIDSPKGASRVSWLPFVGLNVDWDGEELLLRWRFASMSGRKVLWPPSVAPTGAAGDEWKRGEEESGEASKRKKELRRRGKPGEKGRRPRGRLLIDLGGEVIRLLGSLYGRLHVREWECRLSLEDPCDNGLIAGFTSAMGENGNVIGVNFEGHNSLVCDAWMTPAEILVCLLRFLSRRAVIRVLLDRVSSG